MSTRPSLNEQRSAEKLRATAQKFTPWCARFTGGNVLVPSGVREAAFSLQIVIGDFESVLPPVSSTMLGESACNFGSATGITHKFFWGLACPHIDGTGMRSQFILCGDSLLVGLCGMEFTVSEGCICTH